MCPQQRRRPLESLEGWGRRPRHVALVRRHQALAALRDEVLSPNPRGCIARGLGRSYGDAAVSKGGAVLVQTERNRFLGFDETTGVVECEAGVSLADIIEVFLPRGWFLPTTPGTKFVTVGGAIAADVHGKNHHVDGSFGSWIRGLKLLLASGEVRECSPEAHEEVFWSTVGGMGLTGIILEARIQLRRVASAYYVQTTHRTPDLDATLSCLEAEDANYRHSVAWVDSPTKGRTLGRSVIMFANDAEVDQLPAALRDRPFSTRPKWALDVRFVPPTSLVAPWSIRLFNAAYYASHGSGRSVVHYDGFFYPLDRIDHWNRLYGPRGFVQYQALFPPNGAAEGLRTLLEYLAETRTATFVGVLKRSGPASKGVLSFPRPGYTLALDIPYPGPDLAERCRALDSIVLRHGGRVYLAKDSTTTKDAFRDMYPELGRFQAARARLDPEQRFRSAQSERLGITEA